MLADAGIVVPANLGWVVEPSCVLGERATSSMYTIQHAEHTKDL